MDYIDLRINHELKKVSVKTNGNAEPVVCNELAVPDAAITLPSAENDVPPAVDGLPSAAFTSNCANIEVCNVDELAVVRLNVATDKSDDTNSSTSDDSLIPEEWLQFRYPTFIHL